MTAIHPEVEHLDLTEMVEDVDVPCEWAHFPVHKELPATWIAWLRGCPECGYAAGQARLVCDDCKRAVVETDQALACGECPTIIAPGRRVISRLEKINKRAA